MWCELVLNGIGGATIAEAKVRMPQVELQTWVQYRRKHGGFNLGLRIEQGAGRIKQDHQIRRWTSMRQDLAAPSL